MELNVRNTHGQMPAGCKEHAAKRLQKLDRYFNKIGAVEFVHDEIRGRHTIQLQLNADGYVIRGNGEATELKSAIDNAVDHVEGRLKKFRSKLQRKHRTNGAKQAVEAESDAGESEEPRVSSYERYAMKPTSVEEATLQMELMARDFFAFKNEETGQVSVVFRLHDGNYGLMEPEA